MSNTSGVISLTIIGLSKFFMNAIQVLKSLKLTMENISMKLHIVVEYWQIKQCN